MPDSRPRPPLLAWDGMVMAKADLAAMDAAASRNVDFVVSRRRDTRAPPSFVDGERTLASQKIHRVKIRVSRARRRSHAPAVNATSAARRDSCLSAVAAVATRRARRASVGLAVCARETSVKVFVSRRSAIGASSAPSSAPGSPRDRRFRSTRSDAASNRLGLGFVARARASAPRASRIDARVARSFDAPRGRSWFARWRRTSCASSACVTRAQRYVVSPRRAREANDENERARSRFRGRPRTPKPSCGRTLNKLVFRASKLATSRTRVLWRRRAVCARGARRARATSRRATSRRAARETATRRAPTRAIDARDLARARRSANARGRARRAPRRRRRRGVATPRSIGVDAPRADDPRAAARVNDDGARGSDEDILRRDRGDERR